MHCNILPCEITVNTGSCEHETVILQFTDFNLQQQLMTVKADEGSKSSRSG